MAAFRLACVLGCAAPAWALVGAAQRAPRATALHAVDPVLVGGAAVAVTGLLGAAFIDQPSNGQDKVEVEAYFNGETGFGRWKNIYSEDAEVNAVQLDIREGHAETVDKVLEWAGNAMKSETVCDLGCGCGSLAIPLAQRGADVAASDISAAMVSEASERATAAGVAVKFATSDMESVGGRYQTVSCIDVMIHYPSDQMAGMVKHLAGLTTERLFVSFAPRTPVYSVLKKIGGLFPGPSKATRAYLHSDEEVTAALKEAGFEVKQKHLTAKRFYYSLLFEAVPVAV